ncbi:MAG: hypothetical protein AAGG11_20170 [Pseudomonadota bacterium]
MTERATHRWPALAGRAEALGSEAESAPDLAELAQQARADGYQQGFREGLAKGEAQSQEQARAQLAALGDELQNARTQLRDRLNQAGTELPGLLQALLAALAVEAIEQDPDYLHQLLQEAATRLALRAEDLTMVVSADWDGAELPEGVRSDPDLPPRRVEVHGPGAFARLDVTTVVAEVIREHNTADPASAAEDSDV